MSDLQTMSASGAGPATPSSAPDMCHFVPEPERGVLQAFVLLADLMMPEETKAAVARAHVAWRMAQMVGYEPDWHPAAAARLLHLGRVVAKDTDPTQLPAELLRLAPSPDALHHHLAARILGTTSLLQGVAELVAHHEHPERLEDERVRRGAEIVRSSLELQRLLASTPGALNGPNIPGLANLPNPGGNGDVGATNNLSNHGPTTDDAREESTDDVLHVRVIDLQPAMITAAPIRSKDGKVLLAKGYQLTPRIIGLLTHVASEQGIEEPLLVRLPASARGPGEDG